MRKMSEREAADILKLHRPFGGSVESEELQTAVDTAIKALEEIQKYRAIGLEKNCLHKDTVCSGKI